MITQDYAAFAGRFNLSPAESLVLPALFEKAAKEMAMPVRKLLATATYQNIEAGEYLAGIARQVAREV